MSALAVVHDPPGFREDVDSWKTPGRAADRRAFAIPHSLVRQEGRSRPRSVCDCPGRLVCPGHAVGPPLSYRHSTSNANVGGATSSTTCRPPRTELDGTSILTQVSTLRPGAAISGTAGRIVCIADVAYARVADLDVRPLRLNRASLVGGIRSPWLSQPAPDEVPLT
jgi:hypothetical protein